MPGRRILPIRNQLWIIVDDEITVQKIDDAFSRRSMFGRASKLCKYNRTIWNSRNGELSFANLFGHRSNVLDLFVKNICSLTMMMYYE